MHNIIFLGLCTTLIFLPLPFGSTEEWAVLFFQITILILFSLHLWSKKQKEPAKGKIQEEEQPKAISIFPKIFIIIFFAVTLFQLVPVPLSLIKTLSPKAYEIHASLSASEIDGINPGPWHALSFSLNLTLYEFLEYSFYFLFALLVFNHVRTRKETEIFVLILIICAVFQSFYGLIELFGGTERIFGFKRNYHLGSATGTFINRDHFSGFLEMIFPLTLGYMLAKAKFFSFKKGFSLKEKILWFSQEQLQKTMIFGFMAAIIGLGIFFSRSRSGIFIFFITIFLMIVALSAIGGKELNGPSQGTESPGIRGKRFAKILRTVFLLVIFSVVSIGIRPIIERFSLENLKKEERPVYYKNSLDLIKSFFLTGTGPGTFVYAYPMFDKKASEGLLDHAHNDYLEVLAESGVVGGGCLILAAYTALGYIIKRWKRRSGYFGKGVVLGCVLGITAILVHSLSDFNFRIPSNAVYFVTLYALAIRQTLDYENRIQQG